jgi:hypothetical protein
MSKPTESDPQVILLAYKVGAIVGLLMLAGAITFSVLFRDAMSEPVYWLLFVSGVVLAVALPSWLVGQYAKRQFMRAQVRVED